MSTSLHFPTATRVSTRQWRAPSLLSEGAAWQAPGRQPFSPGFPLDVALPHELGSNQNTAFSHAEGEVSGMRAWLPPHAHSHEEQVVRVLESFAACSGA